MTDQPTATVWVVWGAIANHWSVLFTEIDDYELPRRVHTWESQGWRTRIDTLTSTLPADKEETK